MKNKNNSSAVHLDGSAVEAGLLRVLTVPQPRLQALPAPNAGPGAAWTLAPVG